MKTDVLITGAGPVGLTMACELARYGLSLRIIDQTPERTDKSKALAVWPRTLEHLQRIGLAGKFVAAGQKVTQGRFFHVAEEIACIQLGSVVTPFPFGLMIPQSETERLLGERLESLGVTIERAVTLTAITQDAGSVTATLAHADGRSETVTSRWLIGADGAHSTVRHAIDAKFEGETLPSDWVLADLRLTGPAAPGGPEIHLHKDGIVALFPITPIRFRVIANVNRGREPRKSDASQPDPTLADIQDLLDRRDGRGLQASDAVWLSAFHINERKVADFRHGNIFLAGDAAHIHSPAGGQGMNTGMQDAFNLAWKLALLQRGTVSGDGGEKLLASYTAERSPVAASVLKGSGLLTRMGTLDNALLRGLRNQLMHWVSGFAFVQHTLADNISELAVAYPDSPLNGHGSPIHGGPNAGERAPIRGDEPPVSAGNTPRFALFAEANDAFSSLLAQHSDLLEPTLRKPFHEGGLWLVRPDGYVALATTSDQSNKVAEYLDQLRATETRTG